MSALEEWRARGTFFESAGESVFVVDHHADATGDVVLVLHGFPTSSFDWRDVLDAFGGRRVVLFDFPGYGFSDKPDRRYSLFGQADVVEDVVRQLGLERVILVTHDMGDSVGGELLARDLEFEVVSRVLTNGSIYLDLARLTDGQKLLESLPDAKLVDGLGVDAVAAALGATCAPATASSDDALRSMAELVVRNDGDRLLPRLIRYIDERRKHEARWTGAIEQHPSPLHVIWGDADPIAVWPMAERLASRRADTRVTRLENVGHYLMVEAPDRFTAALREL